ncbi:MAG: hypothetical protein Q9190_001570 [Brigantiaea leucoxantha]
MNNQNAYPPPPGLPPLGTLVKPEQIPKLVSLAEDKKPTFLQGVTKLWEMIRSNPPDSPDYKTAYTKLHDVSEGLKKTMNQARAAQNGSKPVGQGSPGQPDPRMAGPKIPQAPGQLQGPEQLSQKVIEAVGKLVFVVPPEQAEQGHQHASNWLREAKSRYAIQLSRYETAQNKLAELNSLHAKSESSSWNPQRLNTFVAKYELMARDARDYLQKFKQQQDTIKMMQKQASTTGASQSDAPRDQNLPATATDRPQSILDPQNPQPNTVSDHQGQPHTVSSALDAARNHANSVSRPSPNVVNTGSGPGIINHSTASQISESSGQPQNSHSHPNTNSSAGPSQQNNSPQVPNPQNTISQGPHPLSHRAAINQAAQAAQSYPQPTYPNSTSQPSAHSQPHASSISNRDSQSNNVKMPIPKELKLPHPQPVAMGPARPSFSGGPSNGAMGPMGQPAIQKHPGYVLEGEGERVLGRKKLEELVRQVTGGVDGEEGETLTAAAEETLLDVADDFVDQIVTAACKLAKLRSSQTLELRDIQLVLERNYNIRIPGYASDELRTVKKIQPTSGWTQKLAAVQAAKVTGGKTDT